MYFVEILMILQLPTTFVTASDTASPKRDNNTNAVDTDTIVVGMSETEVDAPPLTHYKADEILLNELNINQMEIFLEDDMLLNEAQVHNLRKPEEAMSSRTIIASAHYRWPKAIVPYTVDVRLTPKDIAVIDDAMSHIEADSCIRFVPAKSNDASYVKIELHDKCTSWIGCQGAPQVLTVGKQCLRFGTIAHELLHALGFYHQHGAANRDHYIVILKENIMPSKYGQFEKYSREFTFDYNIPYDYGSIMHYSTYAFSSNQKPTIVPLENGATIGQRDALSEGDFIKLNRMYECTDYLD